jgi:hypothetical protein
MVINVGIENIQPDRLLVRNEMNIVTFICKCFSQFRCQYATSPERRIANYSYSHNKKFIGKVTAISLIAPANYPNSKTYNICLTSPRLRIAVIAFL